MGAGGITMAASGAGIGAMAGAMTGAGAIIGAGAGAGACANAVTDALSRDTSAVVEERKILVRVMVAFLLSVDELGLATCL
jgi:hypothetical protein